MKFTGGMYTFCVKTKYFDEVLYINFQYEYTDKEKSLYLRNNNYDEANWIPVRTTIYDNGEEIYILPIESE